MKDLRSSRYTSWFRWCRHDVITHIYPLYLFLSLSLSLSLSVSCQFANLFLSFHSHLLYRKSQHLPADESHNPYAYCWIIFVNISKKDGKDQGSIQLSTTPDLGHQWESDNVTIRHHNENQEVSPFPADDHKASTDRLA